MFSIALAVVFGTALLLATLAALGVFLAGYVEKRRGSPVVPAARRAPSTSSDVSLYVRGDVSAGELLEGYALGSREGLLDVERLRSVCRSLADNVDALRDAAVVYAAPRFYAPYDDGEPGEHLRLRVRSRKPLGTVSSPLERAALRDALLEMSELDADELIAAQLDLVTPKRDKALPRLEALR